MERTSEYKSKPVGERAECQERGLREGISKAGELTLHDGSELPGGPAMQVRPGERGGRWCPGGRNRVSRKQEACVQGTTRGQQARGWAGPQREGVGSGHLGQPGPSQSCELETLL